MQLKMIALALALLAPLAANAGSSNPLPDEGLAIPIDISRAFKLTVSVGIPGEKPALEALARYFEANGFKVHVALSVEPGDEEQIRNTVISGTKHAVFTTEQLNTYSSQITRLASEVSSTPFWTYKQLPAEQ